MKSEVEINVKIRKELQISNAKLIKEIQEAKQMVKIPRLHYKDIEKTDFDGIR